jgi:hypothetical protein
LSLPRRPRRPITGIEYRDKDYDKWAEYYSKKFHNVPETDLTPRQLLEKQKLRQWLNDQSNMRRHPRDVDEVEKKGIYRYAPTHEKG